MKRAALLALPLVPLLSLLPACVPVEVAVPKPVRIDVNMKVDVTSRTEGAAPGAVSTPAAPGATSTNAAAPRVMRDLNVVADANQPRETPAGAGGDLRKLSGEIQSFKNDRLVGENNQGYLEVRQKPDGKLPSGEDYATYVSRIVQQANEDRKVLYQARADKSGDPLQTLEQQGAQRRRDNAFPGEWVQQPDGSWKQK